MTENLHRLTYYSSNRLTGSQDDIASAIRQILGASQRNNARVGVSGALMFNAGCFAQVLEGPRQAVEHVFERIQQDPRHGGVSLLAFEPAVARAFGDWSMAFAGSSCPASAQYRTILADPSFHPAQMTGETLFETLHRLVLDEEAAALCG